MVHGSEDAGVSIHNSSERFAAMMDELGDKLNLARHAVNSTGTSSARKQLYVRGPIDMEGHLGQV